MLSQTSIESTLEVDSTDEEVGAVLMSIANLKAINQLALKVPRHGLNDEPFGKQVIKPSKRRPKHRRHGLIIAKEFHLGERPIGEDLRQFLSRQLTHSSRTEMQ